MPLPKEVCFHHFNYGNPGFQEEGIFRRVRQGIGGPTHIEEGADVIGHAHVKKDRKVNVGDIVTMSWKGTDGKLKEVWEVRAHNNASYVAERMVEEKGEEHLGLYVDGVAIREVGPQGK